MTLPVSRLVVGRLSVINSEGGETFTCLLLSENLLYYYWPLSKGNIFTMVPFCKEKAKMGRDIECLVHEWSVHECLLTEEIIYKIKKKKLFFS